MTSPDPLISILLDECAIALSAIFLPESHSPTNFQLAQATTLLTKFLHANQSLRLPPDLNLKGTTYSAHWLPDENPPPKAP